MAERVSKYIASSSDVPLRQGEIVSNLVQVCLVIESVGSDSPVLLPVVHPYAIVLSQDCDLEQDFLCMTGQRQGSRSLPSILFCEVITAQSLSGSAGGKDIWKRVHQNKDERYHCLQQVQPDEDSTKKGIEALGIDFKRYFTVPADEVYKRLKLGEMERRSWLAPPYAQHLATRFFHYQHRVALPEGHTIKL
ncbi:MAG: hypothetical protein KAV82_02770 [Phycisphaerae bacterium]|nr:hypothetical protein [Phycisphaerae bacterium]